MDQENNSGITKNFIGFVYKTIRHSKIVAPQIDCQHDDLFATCEKSMTHLA